MRALLFYMMAGVALSGPVAAQTIEGTDYVRLAEDEEIALARSAGPDEISADATIWVLRNGEYSIAVRGANANHCFVARSLPQSLEPVCYDEEGAATVLPWEFKYFELRTSGKSKQELEAALAEAAIPWMVLRRVNGPPPVTPENFPVPPVNVNSPLHPMRW